MAEETKKDKVLGFVKGFLPTTKKQWVGTSTIAGGAVGTTVLIGKIAGKIKNRKKK